MLRRLVAIFMSAIVIVCCVSCVAEDEAEISTRGKSVTFWLSNMNNGKWTLDNGEELNHVKVITIDFYMDDVDITLERMYGFTIEGQSPGLDYIILYYWRDDEVIVKMGINVTVDDEMNVRINEVDALPGLYEDYI